MKYKIIKQTKDTIELEEINEEWTLQEIPAKKIEWGKTANREMNWEEAKNWCEKQGGRLPTIVELMEAYHGGIEGFEEDFYWSSSEVSASHACTLDFGNGNVYSYSSKSLSSQVRCVRGQ